MPIIKPPTTLSELFEQALVFSKQKHEGQFRKGNTAPYISHPMVVASYVLECGGSENQAIAALLHDVIEDCGVTKEDLEKHFNPTIAKLVMEVTEQLDWGQCPWEERKKKYIQQVRVASREAHLIALCDKYHNLSSLVHDLKFRGKSAWAIFKQTPSKTVWYYGEMLNIFQKSFSPSKDRAVLLVEGFGELLQWAKEHQE